MLVRWCSGGLLVVCGYSLAGLLLVFWCYWWSLRGGLLLVVPVPVPGARCQVSGAGFWVLGERAGAGASARGGGGARCSCARGGRDGRDGRDGRSGGAPRSRGLGLLVLYPALGICRGMMGCPAARHLGIPKEHKRKVL